MIQNLSDVLAEARFLSGVAGTEITLHWVETTGGTVDRITGEVVGATSEDQSETITGLVHFVGVSKSGYLVHNELQIGDAILDLDPDVDLDTKKNLVFEFGGHRWVQANVGDELVKAWDTLVGDQEVFRTIAVRRQA